MDRTSRRHFLLGALALAGLGLLSGCGVPSPPRQQSKIPHIGYIGSRSEQGAGPGYFAFQQGMHELGYVEGQTYTSEFRSTEGRPERARELAAELIQRKADLICTSGTPTALNVKQATSDIPLVITATGDLVALGLVSSLRRPGGNVTGVVTLAPQLSGKRLELLREAVPRMSRVGLLTHTDILDKGLDVPETRAAARTLGLTLEIAGVRTREEIEGAFATLVGANVEGLLVAEDLYYGAGRDLIVALAAQHRLPAVYTLREFVAEGALLSYGANFVDAHRRAAAHVDRILKGASPADLPVEQPTEFELVINFKTAQALGLTIPQSIVAQATELIQ